MDTPAKHIPMFFKYFSDVNQTERLYLQESWCSYMGQSLPSAAFLRNRYGDSWEVKVAHYQNTDKFWFEKGWSKFVEQNKVAYKDLFVFKYDGESTFDFKLFDENGDEKEYIRIPNSEEEKEKEQFYDMELEQVVPEPEEQRNIHPEPVDSELELHLEQQLNDRPQQPEPEPEPEEQDMHHQSEAELQLEPDLEEPRSRRNIVGRKRAPAITEDDEEAIFRSGFPRPDNPYFVTKRRCKRDELYIPTELVRDFKLKFTEHIGIRDERGNEWTAEVHNWKDSRFWLSKGWKAFCKWNNVKREDWCIIEIVMPETPEDEMFFKAHPVPAAALRAERS